MQSTFASSRILQPVRHWFILLSLLIAFFLNSIPPSAWPLMPDWIALVMIFWSIREPRRVGMGYAFLLGVAMDVSDANLLGQHALAYVLVSYVATSLSKRILWFPLGQQALHVLPLLLIVQCVQFAVRAMPGIELPGWPYFAGPFIGALLWLPLTFVLLLPQYRPVEHDANRPI